MFLEQNFFILINDVQKSALSVDWLETFVDSETSRLEAVKYIFKCGTA